MRNILRPAMHSINSQKGPDGFRINGTYWTFVYSRVIRQSYFLVRFYYTQDTYANTKAKWWEILYLKPHVVQRLGSLVLKVFTSDFRKK